MVNWDRINELREEVGNDDLAEVLALFCEEVEDVLEELGTVPSDALPSRLHFLKGSALNIGLEGVSSLCQSEERRLSENPASQPEIQAIRCAYATARIELEAFFRA